MGFVLLGRRFGGHGGGKNDVLGQFRSRDADEEDGEGKLDVIEKAGDQKDRMRYTGLSLGRVDSRGDSGDKGMVTMKQVAVRRSKRKIDDDRCWKRWWSTCVYPFGVAKDSVYFIPYPKLEC